MLIVECQPVNFPSAVVYVYKLIMQISFDYSMAIKSTKATAVLPLMKLCVSCFSLKSKISFDS